MISLPPIVPLNGMDRMDLILNFIPRIIRVARTASTRPNEILWDILPPQQRQRYPELTHFQPLEQPANQPANHQNNTFKIWEMQTNAYHLLQGQKNTFKIWLLITAKSRDYSNRGCRKYVRPRDANPPDNQCIAQNVRKRNADPSEPPTGCWYPFKWDSRPTSSLMPMSKLTEFSRKQGPICQKRLKWRI
jgi:hypothetical protein